jgi:uncharacterized protein (TIGR03083 family)
MSDQEAVPYHLAYRMIREDVSDLMTDCPDAVADPVPACPDWTVGDVVTHLVRICWKKAARLDDAWDRPFPAPGSGLFDLLDLWADAGRQMETYAERGRTDGVGIIAMDALTHQLDIWSALDLRMPEEHPALDGVLGITARGLGASIREHRLPALRIENEGALWQAGPGEPAGTVAGDRYDLLRSLTGRRTLVQVARLAWDGPVEKWWPAFSWGPFRPPAEPTEDIARVTGGRRPVAA